MKKNDLNMEKKELATVTIKVSPDIHSRLKDISSVVNLSMSNTMTIVLDDFDEKLKSIKKARDILNVLKIK